MNNPKSLLFLGSLVAVMLSSPILTAAPRGGGGFSGGHHLTSMGARPGLGSRGGRGWDGGYPYGYYGYGYPYGYGSPYGYGYGYGYGGNQYGDYGYGNGYGNNGYGNSGYGNSSRSRVAELQRRLARAGYYRGSIDGVLGPQTRRAIRAYEQDHGNADAG